MWYFSVNMLLYLFVTNFNIIFDFPILHSFSVFFSAELCTFPYCWINKSLIRLLTWLAGMEGGMMDGKSKVKLPLSAVLDRIWLHCECNNILQLRQYQAYQDKKIFNHD